ncbi:hypothetical protein [Streptomyces sp. LS1784]|uniref:hypothetical protein n=1 Tax=Streptomyces sp. LS1784 TaxID=2851533 RepID=UPI001CCF812F|nr:hypothetical protein [Streptomyces sp. LS1784]
MRTDTASAGVMQVRSDRITAAQVRAGDEKFALVALIARRGSGSLSAESEPEPELVNRTTLEVFLDGHGPGGQWFVVTEGTGEWFELNADEALLSRRGLPGRDATAAELGRLERRRRP